MLSDLNFDSEGRKMVKLHDLARFGLPAMQNGGKFTVSWT
jgi:hypothetical protein